MLIFNKSGSLCLHGALRHDLTAVFHWLFPRLSLGLRVFLPIFALSYLVLCCTWPLLKSRMLQLFCCNAVPPSVRALTCLTSRESRDLETDCREWRTWRLYKVTGQDLIFFVSAVLLSTFILLFLPYSSVSLSYLNLAVPMRKCLGKHSCMSPHFL